MEEKRRKAKLKNKDKFDSCVHPLTGCDVRESRIDQVNAIRPMTCDNKSQSGTKTLVKWRKLHEDLTEFYLGEPGEVRLNQHDRRSTITSQLPSEALFPWQPAEAPMGFMLEDKNHQKLSWISSAALRASRNQTDPADYILSFCMSAVSCSSSYSDTELQQTEWRWWWCITQQRSWFNMTELVQHDRVPSLVVKTALIVKNLSWMEPQWDRSVGTSVCYSIICVGLCLTSFQATWSDSSLSLCASKKQATLEKQERKN